MKSKNMNTSQQEHLLSMPVINIFGGQSLYHSGDRGVFSCFTAPLTSGIVSIWYLLVSPITNENHMT